MKLRSLLFVPGDRPDRMKKALYSGADALILDLEDSVAASAKDISRRAVTSFIRRHEGGPKLLVRVNPLGSAPFEEDMSAVLDAKPDGIVLPKAEGANSIKALIAMSAGLLILPIVTETPSAIFQIGTYQAVAPYLIGMTWGTEDLSSAIGVSASRDGKGRYTAPFELARSLTLFGAHAANVPAIDTVFTGFHDIVGLKTYAARARCDGFTGMMAIHPAQIPVINAAFTPTDNELTYAHAIVDAFASAPGVGAIQLNGNMIDAPHLKWAIRLLELSQ